jgi:hypothetical protein
MSMEKPHKKRQPSAHISAKVITSQLMGWGGDGNLRPPLAAAGQKWELQMAAAPPLVALLLLPSVSGM